MPFEDIAVRNAARVLIDGAYHLGPSPNGFDCLGLLRHFYTALGIALPPLPEGWTDGNYADRWRKGEGREELYEYLLSIGQEDIDINYIISGDCIIFDGGKWVFPGIYLGSGHVLCAFEKGCMVVPLKFFKNAFLVARRFL